MTKRFATLSLAFLLAFGVLAAPADAELVKIRNTGDALVFSAIVEVAEMVLTVKGPCGFEDRQRSERGRVVFGLPRDVQDGAYNFSIDARPVIDREIMEILTEARKTGDNGRVRKLCRAGKLPTGPTQQAGGFAVLEGKIVLDTTPETQRGTKDGAEKAAEIAPAPQPAAVDRLAVDLDTPPGDSPLPAYTAPASPDQAPGECVWASMQPGAGVAER